MAEIVNLRMARKARKRSEKERAAEQNRLAYGASKAERRKRAAEAEQSNAFLDAHRREPADRNGE